MELVLDTNIYCQDLSAKSSRFEVLLDWMEKTYSRVLLPAIVRDELAGYVMREVRARETRIHNLHTELTRLLPHRAEGFSVAPIDLEKEVRDYLTYLQKEMRVSPKRVVDYTDSHHREVLARAIARKRPCSDRGEEIRDAVLWLTVLDIAAKSDDVTAVFISANTKQFTDGDKLHPDLLADCAARGVTVLFFRSLDEFIRQHAVRVAFATEEWLAEKISSSEIFSAAKDKVFRLARSQVSHESVYRSYPDFEVEREDLGDCVIYVYELKDGSFRLDVGYAAYYELSYEAPDEVWTNEGLVYSGIETQEITVECFINLDITVRDGEVEEWAVSNVERA